MKRILIPFFALAVALVSLAVFWPQSASAWSPDLAIGRPAKTNSAWNANFPPDLAVNGVPTNRWAARARDNVWIGVDLGSPQIFDTIAVIDFNERIISFRVEVMNNVDEWNALPHMRIGAGEQEGLWEQGSWVTVPGTEGTGGLPTDPLTQMAILTFEPVEARFVRFVMVESNPEPSLWQFSIYNSQGTGGMGPGRPELGYGMIFCDLFGPVTALEVEYVKAFARRLFNDPETQWHNRGNNLSFGLIGTTYQSLARLYEITGDVEILELMVFAADRIVMSRNDMPWGPEQTFWTGRVEPVWSNRLGEDGMPDGRVYAPDSEQGDAMGHLYTLALYIIRRPEIHNQVVPGGDQFGFGATWLERAATFVARADEAMNEYVYPTFIRNIGTVENPRYVIAYPENNPAFVAAAAGAPGDASNHAGRIMPTNRMVMVAHALQRAAEVYDALGINQERAAHFHNIVEEALNIYVLSLEPGRLTTPEFPTFTWSYWPTGGGNVGLNAGATESDDHADYDYEGLWRMVHVGRYNLDPVRLAAAPHLAGVDTIEEVMLRKGNTVVFQIFDNDPNSPNFRRFNRNVNRTDDRWVDNTRGHFWLMASYMPYPSQDMDNPINVLDVLTPAVITGTRNSIKNFGNLLYQQALIWGVEPAAGAPIGLWANSPNPGPEPGVVLPAAAPRPVLVTFNDSSVAISGEAVRGETLTAVVTNAPVGANLAFQWQRGSTPIDGATGATYEPTFDDVGFTLRVIVTADNVAGSLTSANTAVVVRAPGDPTPGAPQAEVDMTGFLMPVPADTVNANTNLAPGQIEIMRYGADSHEGVHVPLRGFSPATYRWGSSMDTGRLAAGSALTLIHGIRSTNFIVDFGEVSEITSFNVQIINNAAYFMNFFVSDDGENWTMITEGLSGTGLSRITLTRAHHPGNPISDVNYDTWRLAGGANTDIYITSDDPIFARYFMIAGYGRANNDHDATAPNVIWYDFRNLSFFGPFDVTPVTGVTLNTNATTIVAASTQTLVATVAPADATITGLTWTSSNPAVAIVSSTGVVTALTPGETTITVTTEDGGHTAECVVTVTPFVGPVAATLVFYNEVSVNTETENSLAPVEGDLALGATAVANDGLPTATWGAALNDGVNGVWAFRAGNDRWQKAGGGTPVPHVPETSWIALDYTGVTDRGKTEGTVTFNEIILVGRYTPFISNYVIEVSDNGTDWTLIYVSTQPLSTANGRGSKIAFAETITTTHIRLRALASSDNTNHIQLMRFAIYNVQPELIDLVSITAPADVNLTHVQAAANDWNLPTTVEIVLADEPYTMNAAVTWGAVTGFDAANSVAQTATATGTIALPANINQGSVSLSVTIEINIAAAPVVAPNLVSITTPSALTVTFAQADADDWNLPAAVGITLDAEPYTMNADVTWGAVTGFDPTITTAQTAIATGTITLPIGVYQNNVSLSVTIEINIDAAPVVDPNLVSITAPTALSRTHAQAAAGAWQLPSLVQIVLDAAPYAADADVTWGVVTGFNPTVSAAQTATATGTVTLPTGINQNSISLSVTITINVVAAPYVPTEPEPDDDYDDSDTGHNVTHPGGGQPATTQPPTTTPVNVVVREADVADLTPAQREALDDRQVTLYEVTAQTGNQITVSVPFEAERAVAVWLLTEEGELLRVESEFDPEAGILTFITDESGIFVFGYAEELLPPPAVIRFEVGNTMYTVGNASVVNDVAPFLCPVYERTMLPIRAVAYALGAQIHWHEPTRTVTIIRGGALLSLTIDVPLPNSMGTPIIKNDRTFVPARYVSEFLGAEVDWDEVTQAIYITQ